jgi:glycosyltransferase involved in cell wall biosynthesis
LKIAYIAAGAGGMYCGSCLHDNALARALNALGHPTLLLPTYTPLRTDEESQSLKQVFYGGIGVYLAQRYPALRRPLPLLDRVFSHPVVLALASRMAIKTEPATLGDLTVSVLRGEHGNQKKELEELVQYLEWEARPEVVHLTNSLFAGLAPVLKRRLRVPVICSFQGEDLFLEGLPEDHRRTARELIGKSAEAIDLFVAPSRHTAELMAGLAGIAPERVRVVHPGIRLDGYPPPGARPPAAGRPFTIGYLARIAPEKGLAVLCEAYRLLREGLEREPVARMAGGAPRLLAAGYLGRASRGYLDQIRKRVRSWGLSDGFEYVGELDRREKIEFLQKVDVLSVPSTYPEAMGLFAYEALAAGTPLVLPGSGAFPEIVEATGGGLLVEPGDPAALAAAFRRLLGEPALLADLGRRGAEAVHGRFHAEAMARATLEVYQSVLSRPAPAAKER